MRIFLSIVLYGTILMGLQSAQAGDIVGTVGRALNTLKRGNSAGDWPCSVYDYDEANNSSEKKVDTADGLCPENKVFCLNGQKLCCGRLLYRATYRDRYGDRKQTCCQKYQVAVADGTCCLATKEAYYADDFARTSTCGCKVGYEALDYGGGPKVCCPSERVKDGPRGKFCDKCPKGTKTLVDGHCCDEIKVKYEMDRPVGCCGDDEYPVSYHPKDKPVEYLSTACCGAGEIWIEE